MKKFRGTQTLWEGLLCLVAAVGLTMNVEQGFVLPEILYGALWGCILIEGLWLSLLFLVGQSHRSRRIGIPLLLAAAVAVILLLRRWGIPLIETDVAEQNAGLWYLVAVTVTLMVYLLSRRVGGCWVLVVLGALSHAWLFLLQYTFSLWYMGAFLWAGVALLLYVRYRRQTVLTSTAQPAYGAALITASAVSTMALAFACLVWWGILSAHDLPKQDVNLITQVVSLEVMEKVGISKTEILLDRDDTAQELDEDFDTTTSQQSDTPDTEENTTPQDTPQPTAEPWEETLRENIASISISLPQVRRSYTSVVVSGAAVLLMLGLLIGAFHQRHRLWLLSIRRKSLDAQTGLIYHALRKKLGILGYLAQPGDTPLHYAEKLAARLVLIESEGETWLVLSQIYSRLCYGNATVTEGEYQQFVRYYEHFCKNCRSLCSGGYFWKQFRL